MSLNCNTSGGAKKPYPLAEELNLIIKKGCPSVFDLLSDKGKAIYFPKAGIMGQTAEAKGKKLNATAGIALEDDSTPVRLNSIAELVDLPPADIFPYAPGYGKLELRKLWQEQIRKKNPTLVSPISLPVATNALTNALSLIGYLFVNPGDWIILADRFWGTYRLIFENGYGGELTTFNTFTKPPTSEPPTPLASRRGPASPKRMRGERSGPLSGGQGNIKGFDLESFATALGGEQKKKIVLLNFPNNPSGYTPTEAEARAIVKIIKERAEAGDKLVIITDDAYFGLVYEDGIFRESLFALLADLHPNVLAVKIDGPTKEDYVWGLRVGFITYGVKDANEELYRALEDKTAGAVRGNISNVSNLSQSLVLAGLTSPNYRTEKQQKYELLKSRYLKIKEVLAQAKYTEVFEPLPCNSGYFICLKLKDGINAEATRKLLLEKYDTGVISLKDSLRLAFSSVPTEKIPELIENIYQACLEIKLKTQNSHRNAGSRLRENLKTKT